MKNQFDLHVGHIDIGICGFGTCTPNNRVSISTIAEEAGIPVERLSNGVGVDFLHIATDSDHPLSLGLIAAKNAMEDARISGDDIDLVIFVSAGDYDYRFWSPSSAVIRELGCHHAYAFEVRNGCAGGNLACTIAGGIMDRDPTIQHALIICADTLSRLVTPAIKACHPLLYFGDGAAAVVLKRNHPRYQFLSFSEYTDGELSDLLRIEYGGTRNPIKEGFTEWEKLFSRIDDKQLFADLINKTYLTEYLKVINKALERSGHDLCDIDFLLLNQIKSSLRDDLLNKLGVPITNTYISLQEYGHIGPADALFTLALAHQEKKVVPGMLAVMATSGLGFSWAASVIRC
jgi:3-oxoacyl-[acyl-carrier-protein] synthase-3